MGDNREENIIEQVPNKYEYVNGQRVVVHEEKIQANIFIVYRLKNGALYIDARLAKRFDIESKGINIEIDGNLHYQVNNHDIDYIITVSEGTLLPEYRPYEFDKSPIDHDYAEEDNGITNNHYFTYYEDIESKKLYIPEEISKILKDLNINFEDTAKMIEGKKCYSTTKDSLDDLEKRFGYIGHKQSIIKKHEEKEIGVCELNGDIYIPENILSKYKKDNKNKKIKVDGELYIKISKSELDDIIKSYFNDDINLKFKELKIKPIEDYYDNQLSDMLKETSTTPPTEPSFEK